MTTVTEQDVAAVFARRAAAGGAVAAEAERIARACHDMALRFRRGGRLLVFGNGAQATDAAHIAVEFVHPVIVGKRALPALSLAADGSALTGTARDAGFAETYAAGVRLLADAGDIVIGLSADGRCANVRRGLAAAREAGALTVALAGGDGGEIARSAEADHVFVVRDADPRIVKEVSVTIYHLLWELVHVFIEQPGPLGAEDR